jgi:hypothetical protein
VSKRKTNRIFIFIAFSLSECAQVARADLLCECLSDKQIVSLSSGPLRAAQDRLAALQVAHARTLGKRLQCC